jgi:hypothetical protein
MIDKCTSGSEESVTPTDIDVDLTQTDSVVGQKVLKNNISKCRKKP